MSDDLAATLVALEGLLARQSQALRDGDADALPALAAEVRPHLAALARLAPRGRAPQALRPLIEGLQAQAAASQVALGRRLHDVQQSLDALGAGSARLQDHQLRGTYGRAGTPAGGVVSAGGYGRA